MKRACSVVALLALGLQTVLGCGGVSEESEWTDTEDVAESGEALTVASHKHTTNLTCSVTMVPECTWITSIQACGEGHDDLYTAYEYSPAPGGSFFYNEKIHLTCPAGAPCASPPQTFSLTRVAQTGDLCPGDTDSTSPSWSVGDDDGCSIACAGGDNACCLAIATGLAAEFSWTAGTTITTPTNCDYNDCSATGTFTNAGTAANQITGVSCTLTTSTASTPDACSCCKVCSAGKACGDSCINKAYTCHQPKGCACNADGS